MMRGFPWRASANTLQVLLLVVLAMRERSTGLLAWLFFVGAWSFEALRAWRAWWRS